MIIYYQLLIREKKNGELYCKKKHNFFYDTIIAHMNHFLYSYMIVMKSTQKFAYPPPMITNFIMC